MKNALIYAIVGTANQALKVVSLENQIPLYVKRLGYRTKLGEYLSIHSVRRLFI